MAQRDRDQGPIAWAPGLAAEAVPPVGVTPSCPTGTVLYSLTLLRYRPAYKKHYFGLRIKTL